MTNVADLTTRPFSGYAHIDALVSEPLPWNYIGRNVIYYTFSLQSGLETQNSAVHLATRTLFHAAQQNATRGALEDVAQLTGIQFVETSNGEQADLHFANADLVGYATGLASSGWSYQYSGTQVSAVSIDSWIYLDNADQIHGNLNPVPGTAGYETLLHEIGHALGLQHPFEGPVMLPAGTLPGQDNSATTLMSYTKVGASLAGYAPYDIAALDWLYGRDGLGGARGWGSGGDWLTGSFGADRLLSSAGSDILDGAQGHDTIVFAGPRGEHHVAPTGLGYQVTHAGVIDQVMNAERLEFTDRSINLGIGALAKTIGAGQLASLVELYIAYLDRVPDADGMAYWIQQLKAGWSLAQIGDAFYDSAVFFGDITGYRAGMSATDFVTRIYQNVLGRSSPDAEGLAYWTNALATGAETRASLVATILGSAHTFRGDAAFGWVADLLDHKIAVGIEFAIDQGLVHNTSQASITHGMAIVDAITPESTAAAVDLIGVPDALSLYG